MIEAMVGRLVSPVTIGRRAELEAGLAALDASIAGTPSHLLIAGEAGVGKSRLVGELATEAGARGFLVLRGACASVGADGLPYGPIVDVLSELVRELDPARLEAVVGASGPDLARLVPALDPASSSAQLQREWLQARLFEALIGLLRRLAAQTPVLIVVEDVHWADPATRETLAFLVRSLRMEPVTLAMTLRSDELHRRHPALPWLAELERTGRVQRLGLLRLDAAETAAMLEAITGEPVDPDAASRIHRRSDGNPFFVEELLIAETGQGSSRLPTTLREILLARLSALGESAREVVGIVAVAGRRIDHDLFAAVAEARGDAAPDALDDALRAAIASQVLVVDTDMRGADGYAFRHALLAEVAYDELLPGERRRLHRACAEAIARRPAPSGASAAAYWAELAHHWANAHEDRLAFVASLRAATAAEEAFAFAAALHQLERALDLWPGLPDAETLAGADLAEVLGRGAQMANLGGEPARTVALAREAIASLDPTAGPIRAAVMHERLGRALWAQGESAASLAEHERAMAIMPADPPTPERARVLAGYGQILMLLDQWQASRDRCQEAIDIALQVGAREAEGHARNTLGLDLAAQGDCERAVAELEAALAIAIEVGNADDVGRAHVNLTEALNFCGLGERSAAAIEEGIEAAERYGIASSYGAYIRDNGIQVNFELGRWDRAASLAAQSAELPVGTVTADRYRISRWVPLLVASGDTDAAKAQLDRLAELLDGVPLEAQYSGNYYAAKAELALWEGRPEDALAIAEEGLGRLGDGGWRWFNTRLLRVAAWAAADAAEVARARRDRAATELAVHRGEALRAERDRQLTATLALEHGRQAEATLAERATADAEDTRLHGSTDVAAWAEARGRWSRIDRPYLLAYAGWREGQALLTTGDKRAAAAALRNADAIATSLGARPLAEAIASLARRARIELPDPAMDASETPAPAAPAGAPDPFGLTKREREVLGLVAQGRTNRQIADELFISENTAGVHVSNILGKLGVASRTEAAAVAVRLDMGAPADAG